MGLQTYKKKRDFKRTPEPFGKKVKTGKSIFVIQKHDASHLHYDFRLELDGTLKSWAVPKGPSLDPHQKRLAVQVEDHPIEYAKFEGTIPKGEYGGGEVVIWDSGTWKPIGDAREGYRKGRLEFELQGKKLHGRWLLIRTRPQSTRAQWLLMKRIDEAAVSASESSITEAAPESVRTGRVLTRDLKPVEPQLATLVDEPPAGDQWIHEIKFDGYRTICRVRNGEDEPPILYSRNGLDWSDKYEALLGEISRLPVKTATLDGEIVALDEKGHSDFALLQSAISEGNSAALVYFVFDLLELNGRDLRSLPLIERKEALKKILKKGDREKVRYSDHWEGVGKDMLLKSCELGLEGMVSKDQSAPYSSGRSELWLKSKCLQGQEVIIVGYTPPQGQRIGFGSLVLAAHSPEGELRYLGRVGTGFDREKIRTVLRAMKPLETEKSPFEKRVPFENRIRWLKPKLVAEIYFHGWTAEGQVRQAVFRAIRKDKPASEVMIDQPLPVEKVTRDSGSRKKQDQQGVTLTHPEKVLIPSGKITKEMIRDYLVTVSDWILPHLVDRPLALVRCPDGTKKECFFQKNKMRRGKIRLGKDELQTVEVTDPKGKRSSVMYIDSERGLESLAQMGTIEIHTWGTHRAHVLKPDLLVFDLDPDASIKWAEVAGAALRLRDILEKLGLKSFVKVSGNKGLHLHVPIEPGPDWETLRSFANAVSLVLVEENPKLFLATMSKAKRKGKIFIDFFRNSYGTTSIAPYSLRTKNAGAVALPITWSEVKKVDPKGFTIEKVLRRLKHRKPGANGDPWKDYFSVRQELPDLKARTGESAHRARH